MDSLTAHFQTSRKNKKKTKKKKLLDYSVSSKVAEGGNRVWGIQEHWTENENFGERLQSIAIQPMVKIPMAPNQSCKSGMRNRREVEASCNLIS